MLTLVLILSGCSAIRKQGKTIEYAENLQLTGMTQIEKSNLTGNNFVIQKAEVRVINNGEEKRLLGTLKYIKTGTYLFSIKSIAGIEAARIMINNDTVLVNDRINRKLFYGSSESLYRKYGISFMMLPLIIGDYIDYQPESRQELRCKNGTARIGMQAGRKKILYEIDCGKGKVVNTVITDEIEKDGLRFNMSRFERSEGLYFPGVIVMEDFGRETGKKMAKGDNRKKREKRVLTSHKISIKIVYR